MNFDQFQEALVLLARKKKVDTDQLVQAIVNIGGPKRTNVTEFSNEEWVQRQTDAELYTGVHKYRFNQEGKGRGLQGRTESEEISQSALLDRSAADLRGRKVNEAAEKQRNEDESIRKRLEKEKEEREKKIKEKY